MEMEQEQMPHRLSLSERKKLTVTGVKEVISFEETAVILQTCMGLLTVQGSQLQLKTLSLEGGQVEVEGTLSTYVSLYPPLLTKSIQSNRLPLFPHKCYPSC